MELRILSRQAACNAVAVVTERLRPVTALTMRSGTAVRGVCAVLLRGREGSEEARIISWRRQ